MNDRVLPDTGNTRNFTFRELDGADVRRRGALGALLGLKRDLRALGQRLEAAARDRGVMDEQVLARIVGRDKAVALVVAEPLHGSSWHVFPPGRSCAAKRGRCERATTTNAGTNSPSLSPGT